MFIGREKELKELKEAIRSDSFESILVYGRRRVGKSELVKEALKGIDIPVIRYECKKTILSANLLLFTEKIKEFFKEEYLTFKSFDEIFNYIFRRANNQPIVLFIDEFSFLLEEDKSIESLIANIIDEYKDRSKIKLILSGSYIGLMNEMLEYTSHSYGRFNHIFLIRSFDYFDSSKFYPNYTPEEKFITYSVFGGIPFFNSLLDTKKTPLENIYSLILYRDGILEHEIKEIILGEFKRSSNLNNLIYLIGTGVKKFKDLESRSNDVKPDYYLKRLIDLDIIKKEYPINEPTNKKKIFYGFKDNLIDFYYTFIFGNNFEESRINPDFYFKSFVKEKFETRYLPRKFEEVSIEFLIRKNLAFAINPPFMNIGTYSFDDAKNKVNREFDIVTKDSKGYISYECKYKNGKISVGTIGEEEKQTQNLELEFYKLGFISKNGFAESIDRDKYNLFELNDFYNFK